MSVRGESTEELTQINSNPSIEDCESMYKSTCHQCPKNMKEKDKRRLLVASVVCVLFMIAEITGGIISNSTAIISDGAHLLTDFGAFIVSLAAICISSKPQTRKMNFGFHRAEVLGSLVSVLSLWLLTGILVYMAVHRIIYPEYELDALLMLYLSIAGIFANFTMGLILVISKNDSSNNNQTKSLIVKSAVIHVVGDLILSIGVFFSSLIIYFKPELKIFDPICTFIFSVLVILTTFDTMKDIVRVLMEGFPKHLEFFEVRDVLYSIPGVIEIHNMRLWSLSMDKLALSAHIVLKKDENQLDVLKKGCSIIKEKLNIYEVTLQVEELGTPVDTCAICD